jgi:hypothetical protein
MYHQSLRFGTIRMDRDDPQPTAYMLAGRHMYVLGTADGGFRPIGAEHLVGEMGGFWAHPVRFADGWFLNIHESTAVTRLDDSRSIEGHLSDIQFHFEHGPLAIKRTDFVVEDERAVFGLVEIHNTGEAAWQGRIGCEVHVHLRGSWFSGLETGTTETAIEDQLVLGYDMFQPAWGCVFGSAQPAAQVDQRRHNDRVVVELVYDVELAAGAVQHIEFLLAVDHQRGIDAARTCWHRLAGHGGALLAQKRACYEVIAFEGVTLDVPDPEIVHEYQLAKINVHMLSADYGPYLPPYFLAGVPEYPQLFGCDIAYSIGGITGAGFTDSARSALNALGNFAQRAAGRVPHEVTTNGRVWHPGNTQETPQFTLAVWDYVRWTGDLDLLRRMYPLCREGVMEYLPSQWDFDGDGYPDGDAMIERHGMGSLKLDSACYLYAAWFALAEMANVLGRPEAEEYREQATNWRQRFERDWWIEDQNLYADSLHADLRPQLDGHWTQVVPIQLGIASPSRAQHVLDELERSFVNEYGLVHTRGREELVWTLPTGLLALAQLRHGRLDQAVVQLHNIALTTRHGMLGSFEELIPKGLCFVQLWSAALYLQGIVEGLLGIEPQAHAHRLRLRPRLPEAWSFATLRHFCVGDHVVTVRVTRDDVTITHESGKDALLVEYEIQEDLGRKETSRDTGIPTALADGTLVSSITLAPEETFTIAV